MINSDFHTHSTYCDGKLSLEEMTEAAILKKMDAIGFSGHSHTSFDETYCMSTEDTEKYIREISLLKRKYKGRIEIYLGIERDRFSDMFSSLCAERRNIFVYRRKRKSVYGQY